jgi:hypothetical protein
MPRSAIAAGCADIVALPGEMPRRILDVAGLRAEVSGLMKRQSDVERDLAAAKDEWQRSKPSTLFGNLVKVAAGLAVLFSFGALMWQVADALTAVKKAALQVQAKP